MTARPDILLVIGDQHRADFLRVAGNVLVQTPNLDAIARSGIYFARAVTVVPESGLALAAIGSGRYPLASPPTETPFATSPLGLALSTAGYTLAEITATRSLGETTARAVAHLSAPSQGPRATVVHLPPTSAIEDLDDASLAPYRGNGVPLAAYFAAVTACDTAVGQMVAALETAGRRADTLLIYTALTGEQFKYRDYTNHANTCHDECIRVPLIASWPSALSAGVTSDALVGLHDLAPTIADLAGADLADVHGRSLRPLFADAPAGDAGWRQTIYLQNRHLRHLGVTDDAARPAFVVFPEWPQRAITDGRHKLILSGNHGKASLYDAAFDPEEEFDLFDVSRATPHGELRHFRSRRQRVEDLARQLAAAAESIDDAVGADLARSVLSDPLFGKSARGDPV